MGIRGKRGTAMKRYAFKGQTVVSCIYYCIVKMFNTQYQVDDNLRKNTPRPSHQVHQSFKIHILCCHLEQILDIGRNEGSEQTIASSLFFRQTERENM